MAALQGHYSSNGIQTSHFCPADPHVVSVKDELVICKAQYGNHATQFGEGTLSDTVALYVGNKYRDMRHTTSHTTWRVLPLPHSSSCHAGHSIRYPFSS